MERDVAVGSNRLAAKRSIQRSQRRVLTAEGGAASVDRALALLSSFSEGDKALSLGDLATSTGLYKSTVLRLLASLQTAGFVTRLPEGTYVLGPEINRLHRVFTRSFGLDRLVMPALRTLVDETRESAAFYVRRGDQRLCLFRIDSPQPLRDHAEVGDLLPLDRGSPGKVLMAFGGRRGRTAKDIRGRKVITLKGDRVKEIAGVAAPVFGHGTQLLGALCLSMPTTRLSDELALRYERLVLDQARRITAAAGGDPMLLETAGTGQLRTAD